MKYSDKNIEDAAKYLTNNCLPEESVNIENELLNTETDYEQMKQINSLLIASQKHTSADDAFNRLNARLKPKKNKSRIIKLCVKLAAAAAVASVCYLLAANYNSVEYQKHTATTSGEEISFPDGSTAILNSGSSVSFPKQIDSQYKVKFEGEAYFSIKHNEKRKFIIETANTEVTVLGTAFNLKTVDNPGVEVSVTEGAVKFSSGNNSITVLKDEKAQFDNKQLTKNHNNDAAACWIKENLIFKNTPLKDVAQKLKIVYGVNVTVSSDIENFTLNSRYKNADIKTIMESLEAAFDIKASYGGASDTWILYK